MKSGTTNTPGNVILQKDPWLVHGLLWGLAMFSSIDWFVGEHVHWIFHDFPIKIMGLSDSSIFSSTNPLIGSQQDVPLLYFFILVY